MGVGIYVKSHLYKIWLRHESSSEGAGPLQAPIIQVAARILHHLVSREDFGLLLPILF